MGRPRKENYIKLDVTKRIFLKDKRDIPDETDIPVECLKDYLIREKIKKFPGEKLISFADLKNAGGSNTKNYWLDYWTQSGMIYKIFGKDILKDGREYNKYCISGGENLLRTPRYALIYLCVILQRVSESQELVQYIDQLFSGTVTIPNCDESKKFFEQKQSIGSPDDYWPLLIKAVDAWESGLEEIDYSEDEMRKFKNLLFEDHGSLRRHSEDYGYYSEDNIDEEYDEDEDDNRFQRSLEELGFIFDFDECDEENISENCFTETKITFDRFSRVIAELFSKENGLYTKSEDNNLKGNEGYWGTRSVRFAPYLGSFFLALKDCCKKFPYNRRYSIGELVSGEMKKVDCPKACIEIMTYLFEQEYCPELCIKRMKHVIDKGEKEDKSVPFDEWEGYFRFCADFFYKIMKKNQKYRLSKDKEIYIYHCNSQKDEESYNVYKKCIIYIFERVFAYCLFRIEIKATIIELFKHAIEIVIEKEAEEIKSVDILHIKEKMSEFWARINTASYRDLLLQIYENENIYTRAKLAPDAIKKVIDKMITDECGYVPYNGDEMRSYSFNAIKEEYDIINRILFDIETEVDKTYFDFEKIASIWNKEARERNEGENPKDVVKKVLNDSLEEIHDAINGINDKKIGDYIFEKDMEWIAAVYEEISSWVIKYSLNLKKIELE